MILKQTSTSVTNEALTQQKSNCHDMLVTRCQADGNDHFVIRDFKKVGSRTVPYMYVLGVEARNGKYYCEKATADFLLASHGNTEEGDLTPYAEYTLSISDKLVYVDIVFDRTYIPHNEDMKMQIDEDGIYSYIE